jgi:hypothetical protein
MSTKEEITKEIEELTNKAKELTKWAEDYTCYEIETLTVTEGK